MHWPPFDPQKHPALSILIVKSSFFESDWIHSSPFHCSSLFSYPYAVLAIYIKKQNKKNSNAVGAGPSSDRWEAKLLMRFEGHWIDLPELQNSPPAHWPCNWNPILGIVVWCGFEFLRVCVLGTPTHWGSIIKPPKIHNNSPTAMCFFNSNFHNWCFTQCSESQITRVSLLLVSRLLTAYLTCMTKQLPSCHLP